MARAAAKAKMIVTVTSRLLIEPYARTHCWILDAGDVPIHRTGFAGWSADEPQAIPLSGMSLGPYGAEGVVDVEVAVVGTPYMT